MSHSRNGFSLCRRYLRESLSLVSRHGIAWTPTLASDFPAWYASNRQGRTPIEDEEPWITIPALKFIETRVMGIGNVLEWGSGGSTIFYARRAAKVVSIEHDRCWNVKVKDEINRLALGNIESYLVEPQLRADGGTSDPVDPADYGSDADEFRRHEFSRYVATIDSLQSRFDLISIDGRARPACLAHAVPWVADGGYLLLDNSDRNYYFTHLPSVLQNWPRFDFPGPYKHSGQFGMTTIWHKPAACGKIAVAA